MRDMLPQPCEPSRNTILGALPAWCLQMPVYQQSRRNPRFARQLAEVFDPLKCDPLRVSAREDGYYVIDGQSRVMAVRDYGGDPDYLLDCIIEYGLTLPEEVEIVVTQAPESRRSMRRLHAIEALHGVANPGAVGLVDLIGAAGLTVQWSGGKNSGTGLVAVGTVTRLRKEHNDARVTEALAILREAFTPDARGWGNLFIEGMVLFLASYADHQYYRRADLVLRLRRTGVDLFVRDTNKMQVVHRLKSLKPAALRALVELFNHGRSSRRLPDYDTLQKTTARVERDAADAAD